MFSMFCIVMQSEQKESINLVEKQHTILFFFKLQGWGLLEGDKACKILAFSSYEKWLQIEYFCRNCSSKSRREQYIIYKS